MIIIWKKYDEFDRDYVYNLVIILFHQSQLCLGFLMIVKLRTFILVTFVTLNSFHLY